MTAYSPEGEYPKPWITDPPIEHLKSGWAKLCFQGKLGHYWTEDTATMEPTIRDGGRVRYYESACGMYGATHPRTPAMGVGSWPRCKRCERKRAKA